MRTIIVDGYKLEYPDDFTVLANDPHSPAEDSKASITLSRANMVLTATKEVDGKAVTYTYTAAQDGDKIYLGAFGAELDWRERTAVDALPKDDAPAQTPAATLKLGTLAGAAGAATGAKPYYKQPPYTVEIHLNENYNLSQDKLSNLAVSMVENGKPELLKSGEFEAKTLEGGAIQVTVKKPVTGALRFYVGPVGTEGNKTQTVAHDMVDLTIKRDSVANAIKVEAPGVAKDYFKTYTVPEDILLMPLPQVKRCFYQLQPGRDRQQLVADMADIFQVSKQAMRIRLENHHLL